MATVTATRGLAPSGKTFLGHPRGLFTLSMIEVWERFSYYGMVAILVLYLIAPADGSSPPGPGLGMSDATAAAVFGCYTALVYGLPMVGGWIADRVLGPRRTVLIGAFIIAIGHFLTVLPGGVFWIGLLTIAAGTGLLKPNISAMISDLYPREDARIDSGFSIFYVGINLGAFAAPIIVGYFAEAVSWRLGFALAGVGMLIGILQYFVGRKGLGDVGRAVPNRAPRAVITRVSLLLVVLVLAIVGLLVVMSLTWGFTADHLTVFVTTVFVLVAVLFFWRLLSRPTFTPLEKSRLRAFLALFIGAVVFYAIYNQAGSTINEFALRWTDRTIGSFTVPTSWLQSINPIFILILAPIFAVIWARMGSRAPSTPAKFAIAIVGVGLSFVVMAAPGFAADHGIPTALVWIIATFFVQTVSELLLSPIGLSVTTRLAPVGLSSQLLGLWFLATAVGDAVGGQTTRWLEVLGYGGYFLVMGLGAVVVGGLFALAIKRMKHLMEGVH